MIGIYKIENQINGKAYIGQSINIEQRWKTHIREGKNYHEGGRGYAIHKAISKYGVENFSFVVLEECKEEELNDRENTGLVNMILIIMDTIALKAEMERQTISKRESFTII